jgi:hypothetical protein
VGLKLRDFAPACSANSGYTVHARGLLLLKSKFPGETLPQQISICLDVVLLSTRMLRSGWFTSNLLVNTGDRVDYMGGVG